jgi:hypothetical protein
MTYEVISGVRLDCWLCKLSARSHHAVRGYDLRMNKLSGW